MSTENEDEIRSGRTTYEIALDLAVPILLAPPLLWGLRPTPRISYLPTECSDSVRPLTVVD